MRSGGVAIEKYVKFRVLGELLSQQVQYRAAEGIYKRSQAKHEIALGGKHISTFSTVYILSYLLLIKISWKN